MLPSRIGAAAFKTARTTFLLTLLWSSLRDETARAFRKTQTASLTSVRVATVLIRASLAKAASVFLGLVFASMRRDERSFSRCMSPERGVQLYSSRSPLCARNSSSPDVKHSSPSDAEIPRSRKVRFVKAHDFVLLSALASLPLFGAP